MKKIINNILSIIGVLIIGILIYEGYQLRSDNELLQVYNARYKRELAFRDSILDNVNKANMELDSINKVYENKNIELGKKLTKIQSDYEEAIKELEGKPIDSIAAYIVLNYLGDTYKVKQLDDSTFVAFQEITVRDIANRTELMKAQNKRFEALSEKLGNQDTLIKLQAKNILILNNSIDTLLNKYTMLDEDFSKCENTVIDLTNEVDKQKGLKRIGFYTSAGLLLTLLIIL